jgi:hypothetical protein
MNRRHCRILAVVVLTGVGHAVRADGLVVDKVYHPYVDALEKEFEYRAVVQDTQPGRQNLAQVHQLSLGKAIGDRLFAEVYMIGAKNRASGFEVEAWEAELKWQLTEQGEYGIDWGVLAEYEDERRRDAHEFSLALLAEKELGQFSATANLFVVNEWGKDVVDEVETMFSLQTRYRGNSAFEPGLELYAGQNSRGIGPVLQGTVVTGQRKSLHWEAGAILGIGHESPDKTWRFLIEYEF